ncbi:MAG TPA: hypothetical protein PLJ88_02840 [Agitococcus sp.]|nr:hypothetical protein [Agitococcus sp.]HQV22011.1 hypothetical protein [Agitococcus sp.]
MNQHAVNLFTMQLVFNRLLKLASQKMQVLIVDYYTIATSLNITNNQFILSIKLLSKSDYIEHIFDGDNLYFKITNIGMEYANEQV